MTLVRDVLAGDITTWEIPNLGVAQVGIPADEQGWKILRHELESFVADGEYGAGLERILTTFLNHLGRESQPAAWVSGFYGSGKSHLVRVLDSLWSDREFPDGARAQGLVNLPDEIKVSLRELDTRGRQIGGRFSAAGHLSAGGTSVGLAILAIVFAAAGLPEEIAPARLVLWLKKEGLLEAVNGEPAGGWRPACDEELPDLYVSTQLATAILTARPALANSPADMLQLVSKEFPSSDRISEPDVPRGLREDAAIDNPRRAAAAHSRRPRRASAVHRRQLGTRARSPASRRSAVVAVREPGPRRRHRPDGAHGDARPAEADRPVRGQRQSQGQGRGPGRPLASCCASDLSDTRNSSAMLDSVSGEINRELAGSAIAPDGRGQGRPCCRLSAAAGPPAPLGAHPACRRHVRPVRATADPAADRSGRDEERRRSRARRSRRWGPDLRRSGELAPAERRPAAHDRAADREP